MKHTKHIIIIAVIVGVAYWWFVLRGRSLKRFSNGNVKPLGLRKVTPKYTGSNNQTYP